MRRPDRRRGGYEHVRPRGCPSDTFFPRAPGLPRRRGRAHLPRAAPRDPDADPPHGWMVLSLRPIARRVGGDARARGSVERRGRFLKRAGQRARAQRARDPQQRPAVQAVGEEEQPPARRRGSTQGQQGNEQEEPPPPTPRLPPRTARSAPRRRRPRRRSSSSTRKGWSSSWRRRSGTWSAPAATRRRRWSDSPSTSAPWRRTRSCAARRCQTPSRTYSTSTSECTR